MTTSKRRRLEIYAGLFVNLIVAIVLVTLFLLGGVHDFFRRKSHFQFLMNNAEGLLPGAQVLISGVDAGQVSSLTLQGPSGVVRVTVEISRDYRRFIHADSVVSVMPQGLLGDKVVMITAGTQRSPIAPDNALLASRPGVNINDLIVKGDHLLATLNRVIDDLSHLVGSARTSRQGQKIGRNLGELLANLRDLSAKLNAGVDARTLRETFTKLNRILDKINHGSGTISGLINDPAIYDDLKRLMGEANQNRIVRNMVRQNIEKSEEKSAAAEQAGRTRK